MAITIGKVKKFHFKDDMKRPLLTFVDRNNKSYTLPIYNKGVWQLLRLEYLRKVDTEIKDYQVAHPQLSQPLYHFAISKFKSEPPTGEWQILIKNGSILTVASLNHAVLDESKVYAMVESCLKVFKLENRPPLVGKVIYCSDAPGIKLGVHVYAGDIYTQHAIRFATFMEVESCFNPITFLKLKSHIIRTSTVHMERMLRIHKKSDMEKRLPPILTRSIEAVSESKLLLLRSKGIKITDKEAKTLLIALNSSYFIGKSVTSACIDRWEVEKSVNGSSLWDLAMSASWVAQHSDCFDNRTSPKTRGYLSTIAGALLLIDNLKESLAGSLEYIKSNDSATKLWGELG